MLFFGRARACLHHERFAPDATDAIHGHAFVLRASQQAGRSAAANITRRLQRMGWLLWVSNALGEMDGLVVLHVGVQTREPALFPTPLRALGTLEIAAEMLFTVLGLVATTTISHQPARTRGFKVGGLDPPHSFLRQSVHVNGGDFIIVVVAHPSHFPIEVLHLRAWAPVPAHRHPTPKHHLSNLRRPRVRARPHRTHGPHPIGHVLLRGSKRC